MLKDLETQKMKNRLEIMKLDVQIKAHNSLMEQYKQIDLAKFNDALSTKVILMEQYQSLNYEQTLLNQEIEYLKSEESRGPANNQIPHQQGSLNYPSENAVTKQEMIK